METTYIPFGAKVLKNLDNWSNTLTRVKQELAQLYNVASQLADHLRLQIQTYQIYPTHAVFQDIERLDKYLLLRMQKSPFTPIKDFQASVGVDEGFGEY